MSGVALHQPDDFGHGPVAAAASAFSSASLRAFVDTSFDELCLDRVHADDLRAFFVIENPCGPVDHAQGMIFGDLLEIGLHARIDLRLQGGELMQGQLEPHGRLPRDHVQTPEAIRIGSANFWRLGHTANFVRVGVELDQHSWRSTGSLTCEVSAYPIREQSKAQTWLNAGFACGFQALLQLSRPHHTVDLKPVQPVGELSKLGGAFQGVILVHHSLHALSMFEGRDLSHEKIRENVACV